MRFLADESCDFAVVRALRAEGYDVVAVSEIAPRADDRRVIELALKENCVLLTEDKDFGQLVFAHKESAGGVILLRYPTQVRSALSQAVVELVSRKKEDLHERFVVLRPGRVRMVPKL